MGLSPVKHILTYLHFTKGNVVQRIMHDIKYKNNPQLGELMGFYYGLDLNNAGFSKEFDLITSVPLHQKRLKERGYNQSDFIAKGLSKGLAIPFEPNLIARIIYTDTQITKSKMNRFANMDNVFQVHDAPKILGKRILLVDDTLTTSATLSSCANILWKAAAAEVSVMALASVD
ncbi:MAG: ComF family protein [Pseudarcicella sp.]|nr:ComF family protein [Pseudarcicella sp.]MBP6409721.1 ComF family protein [Pseudarcicella sp.]